MNSAMMSRAVSAEQETGVWTVDATGLSADDEISALVPGHPYLGRPLLARVLGVRSDGRATIKFAVRDGQMVES